MLNTIREKINNTINNVINALPLKKNTVDENFFKEGIVVGYGIDIITSEKKIVRIPFPIANRHTYILGATGSGKTVLLRNLAYQIVRAGYGLLFFDMKGGKGSEDAMKDLWLACLESGREDDFIYFSPIESYCESATWNPLLEYDATITTNTIFDALRSMNENTAFYEDIKYDVLLKLITALKSIGKPFKFGDIAQILSDQSKVEELGNACNGRERSIVFGLLNDWKANPMQFVKNITGTKVTLQRLSTDALIKKIVETTTPTLSLKEAVEKRKVIFCLLPTLFAKESMRNIAKMMLSNIKTVAGELLNVDKRKTKFFIIVDEFEELVFPAIKDMFNKAREAGISMIVAHQTMQDLKYETGSDAFGKSIIDNTATKIIMQIKSRETAEYLSDIIGHYQDIPFFSKYMKLDYIVPPETLMGKNSLYTAGLDVGEAITKIDGDLYRINVPWPGRREKIQLGKDIPFPKNNCS